jgi:hypothetical protein
MADELQPDQGQGPDTTGGIFDSYLNAVPEEHRETVTGYLKDAEKNVNERLAEAANLKKEWEPYKEVGALSSYSPEDLAQLLEWHQQVSASPDAYQTWLATAAQEAGLTPAQAEELDEAEESGELTREQVQQIIAEQSTQATAPLEARLAEFEQQRGIDIESEAIRGELDRLEKDAHVELSENQRAMVIDLGMPASVNDKGEDLPVGDTSWIGVGFDRLKEVGTEYQRAFVEGKANQPASAMTTGGVPSMKPITSFDDAKQALRERFAQST